MVLTLCSSGTPQRRGAPLLHVRHHDMHQSFPHAFPSDPGVYLQKARIVYFLIAIVVVVLVVRGQLSA